jgi:hypothetical protein
MAVSVSRSRKIDFQAGSADKHLVRYGTECCGELVEQILGER